MIVFHGVGGQRFVANNIGLKEAVNYYFFDDVVPRIGNSGLVRRVYAANQQFTVYRLPAAVGGSGHGWVNNYATLFANAGGITLPNGSRQIRFGGGAFPFSELRFDFDPLNP